MLYVKDFVRMRDFYAGVLQAQPINTEWTDTWALFDAGGAKFALHAIPPDHAAGIELASPPVPRTTNPVKLIFAVEDLSSERARLEARGVTVLPQSAQSCECIDPEGNLFQITARTHLPQSFGLTARAS